MDLAGSLGDEKRIKEVRDVLLDCGCPGHSEQRRYRTTEIEGLRSSLQEKITVLAGPSGTGKSTLINKLKPELCSSFKAVSAEAEKRPTHNTSC